MTEADHFARVEALFEQARDLGPDARRAYLDRECGDVPELRRELDALLAHHDRGGLLDDPIHSTTAPPAHIPERVGRYCVIECLGRGGMGVVYRAEQEQPRRMVAVKMMCVGLGSAQLRRRFEFETSVLARLQHPGIAQIYEVGTWDDGNGARPFFAMEFIDGVTLDEFVARGALSVESRLRLFMAICDAVHHAHQKGVIHRDLKPGNILVTQDGAPKILDFGVARATDADLLATMCTMPGQLVGTLAYMSPEQVNTDSDRLDTRSDVYALGVILYEMLTGRLPYDLEDKSLAHVARVISDDQPHPLASHDRTFRGDLATIVGKALEKEPERRYSSVSGLIADIRRFLAHEPIAARPASAIYQVKKFAQRNKAMVSGIAAAIVILLGATVGIAWQSARVKAEAQTRGDVADFLREMLTSVDPAKTGGEPLTVRDMLDDAAVRLEHSFASVPFVRADLQSTVGATYHVLGEYKQAEHHLRRAAEDLKRERGLQDERTLDTLAGLGYALREMDRLEEAETLLRGTLAQVRDLGSPAARNVRHNLAVVVDALHRPDEAEALFRENYESVLRTDGAHAIETAHAAVNLGKALMDSGRHDEALPLFEQGLATLRRGLGDDDPATISAIANLAALYYYLGRQEESGELLHEAADRSARVLGPVHLHTLRRRGNIIRRAIGRGDFEAGIAEATNLVAICESELGSAHSQTLGAVEVLVTGVALGRSMEEAERIALDWHERLASEHGSTSRGAGRMAYLVMNLYDSWGKDDLEAEWRRRAEASVYIAPEVIRMDESTP